MPFDVAEVASEAVSEVLVDDVPEPLEELLDDEGGGPSGGGPPGGGPCMSLVDPSLPCDDGCAAIILSRKASISSVLSEPSPSESMAEKSFLTSADALSRPNSLALTLPSPLLSKPAIGSSGVGPLLDPLVDCANCVVDPPNWNWAGGGGGPLEAEVAGVSDSVSELESLASANVASLLLRVDVDALEACDASRLQSEDALEVEEICT